MNSGNGDGVAHCDIVDVGAYMDVVDSGDDANYDSMNDGGDNGYRDLPVVRMDEERSVVFLIRSL